MENSLISILMLSIKKYILIYWFFQYFTVPFLKSLESFISSVFMEFNTPKVSSARSERLFIGGKLVLETKLNCLGDKNFEKLLLLKFNKRPLIVLKCVWQKINIDTDTEKYCNILVRYWYWLSIFLHSVSISILQYISDTDTCYFFSVSAKSLVTILTKVDDSLGNGQQCNP